VQNSQHLPLRFARICRVTRLDPVKALIWSAIINGVAAVPIMAMIMLMASRRAVMGEFVLTKG
jgi:Mn2+/Fe2+ NRAMP family transporter